MNRYFVAFFPNPTQSFWMRSILKMEKKWKLFCSKWFFFSLAAIPNSNHILHYLHRVCLKSSFFCVFFKWVNGKCRKKKTTRNLFTVQNKDVKIALKTTTFVQYLLINDEFHIPIRINLQCNISAARRFSGGNRWVTPKHKKIRIPFGTVPVWVPSTWNDLEYTANAWPSIHHFIPAGHNCNQKIPSIAFIILLLVYDYFYSLDGSWQTIIIAK